MQPKKNLTQAQRVMLDKLYTKQFDLKRREVRDARDRGYTDLSRRLVAKFEKQPHIAKAIKLAQQFNDALKAINSSDLQREGVGVQTTYAMCTLTARQSYGYAQDFELPELTAFKKETEAIMVRLNQAENEMRLRIHGSEVTYAEIEAEINAILKGVKL